jgi:hypothetical protein
MAERKKTIEINRINLTSALNPFRVQSKTSYSDLSNSDTSSTGFKVKPIPPFNTGAKPEPSSKTNVFGMKSGAEMGTPEFIEQLIHNVGRVQAQKDPSIIALEEQIAANQAKINLGETTMAKKKLASMRARQGRGGAYSLLGSMDRLG